MVAIATETFGKKSVIKITQKFLSDFFSYLYIVGLEFTKLFKIL